MLAPTGAHLELTLATTDAAGKPIDARVQLQVRIVHVAATHDLHAYEQAVLAAPHVSELGGLGKFECVGSSIGPDTSS